MQFEKGVPVGKTSGWDGSMRFEGQFAASGLLDETWMFEYSLNDVFQRVYRVYDKGRFMAHYAMNHQKRIDFSHAGLLGADSSSAEGWEQLPLQSALFEVLYETKFMFTGGTPLNNGQMALIRQANHAVSNLLSTFGHRNGHEIWSIAGGSTSVQLPQVKVPVYPFSVEESQALEKGLKHAAWIENQCNSFYEDATVDIGRYGYQEVAFSYELIRIYQQAAQEWAKTLQIFENEAYKYINRERLLSHISPQINFPDSIHFEFKEAHYVRASNFPDQAFVRAENLAGLAERLERAEWHLRGILDQVDVTLEDYKREEQLAHVEVLLISRRDSILALYAKELRGTDFNGYHAALASSVLAFTKAQFRQFATMTPEARLEIADATLACFSDLIFLYGELYKQPLRESSLKEIYTRTTWNAYTFTDMDEIVKERLYRAYETELLPAITRDIEQHLACGNIRMKALNYAAVYKRMQELRETDTRQLERQLRKSGNVGIMVDVFEFDLNLEVR